MLSILSGAKAFFCAEAGFCAEAPAIASTTTKLTRRNSRFTAPKIVSLFSCIRCSPLLDETQQVTGNPANGKRQLKMGATRLHLDRVVVPAEWRKGGRQAPALPDNDRPYGTFEPASRRALGLWYVVGERLPCL